MTGRQATYLLLVVAMACQHPSKRPQGDADSSPTVMLPDTGSRCELPKPTTTILEREGAVLETWTLRLEDVANKQLPDEPAFVEYRQAIERDGADVVRPVADPPVIHSEAEAEDWRNEFFNNDLVFEGGVGSIEPISCLDALLFARQASRFSQIKSPTEFLASVLRRDTETGAALLVVFGAGSEMFPPKDVYGFELVDAFLADGWTYWYAIHNHTVQKNGDRLALGIPVPSTSDVQLYRWLAKKMALRSVRVTNGFYTFSASVDELEAFRTR